MSNLFKLKITFYELITEFVCYESCFWPSFPGSYFCITLVRGLGGVGEGQEKSKYTSQSLCEQIW